MKRKHDNFKPAIYATYFRSLSKIANDHGYALALHGSMVTDLDLIAVPWIKKPKAHRTLIRAIVKSLGTSHQTKHIMFAAGKKPHGRIVYTVVTNYNEYLDLSIMPVIK